MGLESRSIQTQRDLGQLPLAATVVQLTNHQQDPRLHLHFTATRAQNSSQSLGFAKSRLFDRRVKRSLESGTLIERAESG